MARMALLILLGGVLGDDMPWLPRLGPDDPGQGAPAERRVDLLAKLVEDVVRIALQKILFRPDADLCELSRGRFADIRQVGDLAGGISFFFHAGPPRHGCGIGGVCLKISERKILILLVILGPGQGLENERRQPFCC